MCTVQCVLCRAKCRGRHTLNTRCGGSGTAIYLQRIIDGYPLVSDKRSVRIGTAVRFEKLPRVARKN